MGFPTYMYRLKDGEIEACIFDSDDLPKGWYDSPNAAESAEEKPKRGRPRKVKDGDSNVQ